MDAGADFITTQLFFDNRAYFEFIDECKAQKINIPVLPGLLPVLSLGQVERFCKMCEAALPSELRQKLEDTEDKDQPRVGSKWAKEQIKELLNRGAPGFHLYALNQSAASLEILDGLPK